MSNNLSLALVMDRAARGVLAGTKRPYEIANEAVADIAHLDQESESRASVQALLHWTEISDLLDAPGGPQSEELCDAVASEFSRAWLKLANRDDELTQEAFMTAFDEVFDRRLQEYRTVR